MREPSLRTFLAAGGVTRTWVVGGALAWAALAVFGAVTVPLKYPYEAADKVVDSGVVVGLLLPVVFLARLLDEGPAQLIASASRSLVGSRLARAGSFLLATVVAAGAAGLLVPVSWELLVADATLLAALLLAGAGVVGLRAAWVVPLLLLAIASSPSLVPWELNFVYRQDKAGLVFLASTGVALLGAGIYARTGSHGLGLRRSLRRGDTDVADG